MAGEQQQDHPMVDGAAINPYDLPGVPRRSEDPDKYAPSPQPDAAETMPVPGPGDPDAALVEVGGEGKNAVAVVADDGPALDFLSDEQRANLTAARYGTSEAIRTAGDQDLLAVDGIGPATVEKIRAATRG